MAEVTIKIDTYTRVTIKWFVMNYLFNKSNGLRRRGEEYTFELYRAWTQLCAKTSKKCGTEGTFRTAVKKMRDEGMLELSREEEGMHNFPRRYFILTEEYYEYMENEKSG
jgi:hypothetical protein